MENKQYRNNSGFRIQPINYQPVTIYTRSDVSAYRINEPVYSEDKTEQYLLADIVYLGRGVDCIAQLTLIPVISDITAD